MIQDRLVKENGCRVICDNTAIPKEEWLEIRKGYLNGTDVGKLAGVCLWGNELSVYLDKTMPLQETKEDNSKWFKFQCGLSLEPLIAGWYQKVTGYQVENVSYMLGHPEIPFLAGDMDYIAETPEKELVGIEIKTTDEMNVNEHFRAGILGVDGKLPSQYEYQVRHYMAVTGLSRFIVLVCYGFDSSKVIPVTVYRDLSFEEQMLGMEISFWNRHVVPQDPPEERHMKKEDLKRVQKEVFDPEAGQEDLPEEADEVLAAYQELTLQKKEAELKAKELEEQLNAVLAEICRLSRGAPLAVRPIDGKTYYEVVNKVASRTTVDSEKLKMTHPEAYRECRKVSAFEQTTVRVKKFKKAKGE